MLALALILLSQFDPHAHHTRDSSRTGGRSLIGSQYAFFEFAPLSGAGMGTACACTTPTGARGEALTFTRSSSAMCHKGSSTTEIANGDFVLCSTNQPRVTSGGTGALGLLLEAARTNRLVRSQEVDNASWTKIAGGVAIPTVTADYGVAPDGTTTADRIQIPATSAAQYSLVGQNAVFIGASAGTASVYVKGVSAGGTVCLGINDFANTCTYTATGWTRCILANYTPASSSAFYFGNYGAVSAGSCAGQARAAQDFLMWGAQGESSGSAYATSYIPTVAATVTRAADSQPTVANTLGALTAGSMAISVIPLHSPTGAYGVGSLDLAGGPDTNFHAPSTPEFYVAASTQVTAAAPVWTVGSTNRLAGYWGGGTVGIILNGTTTTAAASPTTGTITKYGLNCYSGGGCVDGIVKQFCFDPVATRCR